VDARDKRGHDGVGMADSCKLTAESFPDSCKLTAESFRP